jgi:hypothetical protein
MATIASTFAATAITGIGVVYDRHSFVCEIGGAKQQGGRDQPC